MTFKLLLMIGLAFLAGAVLVLYVLWPELQCQARSRVEEWKLYRLQSDFEAHVYADVVNRHPEIKEALTNVSDTLGMCRTLPPDTRQERLPV